MKEQWPGCRGFWHQERMLILDGRMVAWMRFLASGKNVDHGWKNGCLDWFGGYQLSIYSQQTPTNQE